MPTVTQVQKELAEIEQSGIIKLSTSEWASPMVLVGKDGTLRMCVDYHRLNAIAHADAYPIPCIDVLIDSLHQYPGSHYSQQGEIGKMRKLSTPWFEPYRVCSRDGLDMFITRHPLQ